MKTAITPEILKKIWDEPTVGTHRRGWLLVKIKGTDLQEMIYPTEKGMVAVGFYIHYPDGILAKAYLRLKEPGWHMTMDRADHFTSEREAKAWIIETIRNALGGDPYTAGYSI